MTLRGVLFRSERFNKVLEPLMMKTRLQQRPCAFHGRKDQNQTATVPKNSPSASKYRKMSGKDNSSCSTNIASSEMFQQLFTEELKKLEEVCSRNGMEIRIAGGAVRDILSKVTPHDLDFATTTLPEDMAEIFKKESIRMIENGHRAIQHGTVTVRINDKINYEITTTRSDSHCHGRHASVRFHKDWELDARRRDFTINAMFLDLKGNLYDYVGGYEDLMKKRVRFVGDAEDRIHEDYLRIMRYFRFCGRLTASDDESTLEVIRNSASGLEGVAGERIWVELKKILKGPHADHQLENIIKYGVAEHIGIPGGCCHESFRELVTRESEYKNEILEATLLASLLSTTEQVEKIHSRLKLSRIEYTTLLFIVQDRDTSYQRGDPTVFKNMIADSKTTTLTHIHCKQLALYMGDHLTYNKLSNWTLPKFPFNASIFVEAGIPWWLLSQYVEKVKVFWRSDFSADQVQLEEFARELLSERCTESTGAAPAHLNRQKDRAKCRPSVLNSDVSFNEQRNHCALVK